MLNFKGFFLILLVLAAIGWSSCAESVFHGSSPRENTPVPSQIVPGGIATGVDSGEAALPQKASTQTELPQQSSSQAEWPQKELSQAEFPQIKQQTGGIPGGHFDLDTSIATYPFSAGQTAHHVHEYDDKFATTGVDFFNLLDSRFVKPNLQIPTERVFRILVANGQFSPGARFVINEQSFTAQEWVSKSATRRFSLAGVPGTEKLVKFQVVFSATIPVSSQLIGTTTELVRSNALGPQGTYRAGALTIQCIDDTGALIDAALGVIKVGSPGLLWEATVFYHREGNPEKP